MYQKYELLKNAKFSKRKFIYHNLIMINPNGVMILNEIH